MSVLRWLTLTGVLFWLVVYWRGGSKAIHDVQESVRSGTSRMDSALMITILFCTLVLMGTAFLMSIDQWSTNLFQNRAATIAGCLLSVVGIAGMFYCRHILGRFWTAQTTLFQDHKVVDQGPYKIVRHPIYTFAILMYIGLGLVFPTWWNLLSVFLIVVSYILKAQDEDRYLAGNLPGYREYQQRVPFLLLPGLAKEKIN